VKPPESSANSLSLLAWLSVGSAVAVADAPKNVTTETLHVILVVRMRRHQPTRDYITRRLAEGKTKNEIMRCLKRYIAREIFHTLHTPNKSTTELIA
jgi:hypothetical protein